MSIKNLIKSKESQILEFKSKVSDKDNIGKDICAFANTNNGTILVGITDKGKVIGVGKEDEEKVGNLSLLRPTRLKAVSSFSGRICSLSNLMLELLSKNYGKGGIVRKVNEKSKDNNILRGIK
jgi:hypothetical protein